jgi:lipopolysaccharide biosynthesis protein
MNVTNPALLAARRLQSQVRSILATIASGAFSLELFTRKPISFGQAKKVKVNSRLKIHESTLGVFVHIYYEDFIQNILEQLKSLPVPAVFYFSVASESMKKHLEDAIASEISVAEIRVVPNRGRNFGPLLVEFAGQMSAYDFVLHLHSKKSEHAGEPLGKMWSNTLVSGLLGPKSLACALALLNENSEVGLIYPDMAKRFRRVNHFWGSNRKPLTRSKFFEKSTSSPSWNKPLAYPVGGMFLARTDALRELISFEWSYEMFPEEKGQLDGTLQHALERYVGFNVTSNGFEHAVFTEHVDEFICFMNGDAVKVTE